MEWGIVITALYLFGIPGLVIFTESLEKPPRPQPRVIKSKPRVRVAHDADTARARKKAA